MNTWCGMKRVGGLKTVRSGYMSPKIKTTATTDTLVWLSGDGDSTTLMPEVVLEQGWDTLAKHSALLLPKPELSCELQGASVLWVINLASFTLTNIGFFFKKVLVFQLETEITFSDGFPYLSLHAGCCYGVAHDGGLLHTCLLVTGMLISTGLCMLFLLEFLDVLKCRNMLSGQRWGNPVQDWPCPTPFLWVSMSLIITLNDWLRVVGRTSAFLDQFQATSFPLSVSLIGSGGRHSHLLYPKWVSTRERNGDFWK